MSGATRRARRAPVGLAADVLVLDVGNSKLQGVLFVGAQERFRWRVDYSDGASTWSRQSRVGLAAARRLSTAQVPVVIASVVPRRAAVVERQARTLGWRRVRRLTHRDPWPNRRDIEQPESIGIDRLANTCGLSALGYPGGVAIDAGTAITIDILFDGVHRGGLILPGIRLWAASLHARTAQLPLVSWHSDAEIVGRDTRSALRAGLRYGLVGALRGIVAALRAQRGPRLPVVFTGGDGAELQRDCAVDGSTFEPDLLVRGVRHLMHRAR